MKAIRNIALLAAAAFAPTVTGQTVRTIGELKSVLSDMSRIGERFDVSGEVCAFHPDFFGAWLYTVGDGTNICYISEPDVPGISRPGPHAFGLLDRIRVSGQVKVVEGRPRAVFDASELLSEGDLDSIPTLRSEDIADKSFVNSMVSLRGRIRDAVRDDTDPTYIRMALHDEEGLVHLMVIEPPQFPSDFMPLVGAEVVAVGVCCDGSASLHRHFGNFLNVSGLENVTVCTAPDDFATAPDIAALESATPRRMASAGFHQTSGTVLAAWGEGAFLMRNGTGGLTSVRLPKGARLPHFGNSVRVLGLPVTDTFHINLVNAKWEMREGRGSAAPETPVDTCAADLTTDQHGFLRLTFRYHGKTVRLVGVVRYMPDSTHALAPIQLESDGQIIAVDTSSLGEALPKLEIGSRVSISGICVMDMGLSNVESGIREDGRLILVPRTPDDVVVLSHPPWWTTGRLLALLGLLATVLFVTALWNVSLNRRARSKGRELAAEQLAHVSSELKVSERTRLAVELHDALSQTLTGISMQIDTAAGIVRGKEPTASKCLDLASRTVDACRTELRNTLWDLRNSALDEPDLNEAIRKTICRSLAGIELSVRFNVPREMFSDNTAHAVLRILRELATNAARHGGATAIKIAGSAEGDVLRFSLADNGCGFDPDLAPGIAQGHFGLQGISERLARANGTMSIDSAPGRGAKVTVSIPIPKQEK